MGIGAVLLIAAFVLTGYNIYDDHRAKQESDEVWDLLEEQMVDSKETDMQIDLPEYVLHPEMEMPVVEQDGIQYVGALEIPAYDLTLPIIDDWSYPNLKIAPCRYSGSAYRNNMVLAGHNYKSHFGKLKNLVAGDEIIFTDMDGNRFVYQVAEQEVLEQTAVEEMKTGDWDLTLFTCTYGGQMRMALRCFLVES